LLLLSTVITSVVAAHWLNNRFNYQWKYWKFVFAALGIFIVLKLITLLPFLGWLIALLTVCMAFGAILQNINWKRKQQVEIKA
jgi:cell division protein FtsW (lipid II flippase)